MSSLFRKRKGIVWLLLVVTVFQTFISSFSASNLTAYATENANDRIQNSINLARGKSITEIDTTQITDEDLQVIGVFLSNFYEPWSTEVIDAKDEDDIKKQQTDALVNTCNFDKDLADVLVQACWEMSRQSATPLYIGKITDNDTKEVDDVKATIERNGKDIYYGNVEDHDNMYNEDGSVPATYFSFLDWFSGLSVSSDTENKNVNYEFLYDKHLCLFWKNSDGVKIPVFDTKVVKQSDMLDENDKVIPNTGMKFTPSSLMYLMINDELNYKKGVGSSVIGCSLDAYNDSLNDAQQKEAAVLTSRLYVDCFGNILVDTGISKYVLVPACANPYAWAKDKDYKTAGNNINCVNLFMLGETESDNLTGATNSDGKMEYTFNIYTGDSSLTNLNYWRISYGDTATNFDMSIHWFSKSLGKGGTVYESMSEYMMVFEEGGKWRDSNNQLLFPSWGSYNGINSNATKGTYTPIKRTDLITNFIQIDTLGEFKTSDEASAYSAFAKYEGGIFEKAGDNYIKLDSTNGKFSSSVEPGHLNIPSGTGAKKYLTGIFCSYVLAYFNEGATDYPVDYYYAKNQFPPVGDTEVDWSSIEVSDETMTNEIKSMIYYFLHPTEGISYVATWFKNKISGVLVNWHEDMVGGSDTANTTGSTRYLGFSGYVTLPTLTDIEWTSWLLKEYNSIVIYLIIIIFIILITYCIVGSMTFQRAIIGTLLFGILAFFPPLFINASVNFINNTCDEIYGDKFTYWAIVQHSSYLSDLSKAVKAAKEKNQSDSYLAFLFSNQESVDAGNYTRIRLKWLSPKKISTKADVAEGLKTASSSHTLSTLMGGIVNSETSGESFSDNSDALYLYRDYADLYLYSTSAYNSEDWYDSSRLDVAEKDLDMLGSASEQPLKYGGSDTSVWSVFSKQTDTTLEYTTPYWLSRGFLVNTGDKDYSVSGRDFENKSYTFLLDSMAYSQISKANKKLVNDKITKKTLDVADNFENSSFGLGLDNFTLTLADLREGVSLGDASNVDISNTLKTSKVGDFYYALYTESPFYFFTWNILDQQTSTEFGSSLNTSNNNEKLLDMYTMNNQQYFYNYNKNSGNGYGELRDFTNMHSLFYYVIPYLNACNQGVLEWSDLYGTFMYDDVLVDVDDATGEVTYPNFDEKDDKGNLLYTDEYIYKWWHNYNVERLFNTYSAWIDVMYSCDYADSETISVSGERYLVQDPLNPLSYCKINKKGEITDGRMMVFSRSEMKYYGLSIKDLTTVEQKIIKVQDQVYKDLLQLMDYYNLGDSIDMNEVLTTSSGMLTTFAFNKEFSQTTPFGTNYTLYPQSYELKAFSYDAYLRLILAESTGESLLDTSNSNSVNNGGNKSYYQRIVENSSITTGVGFIILDIIAVYAIPALKLFFLIAIFFMSVLMIIAAAVKLEMNIVKTTWDSLVAPVLKFLAVSIGMAWVVSLFMTDGSTAITGRGGLTISLGDPAMVVLVMIVINLAVLILYYKICKKCFKKLIEFAKAIGTSVGGAVAGTVGKVAGGLFRGKQVSDSVARGTAKARGKGNQPSATTSAGSGGNNNGSRLGSFAKGALFGKVADDIGDAARDAKSAEKKAKYDDKAKSAENKVEKLSNKDASIENTKDKTKKKADSYSSSADSVKNQRDELKKHAESSRFGGKTSDFVKDKGLAAKETYYRGASKVTSKVGSAKVTVKKGVNNVSSNVRNSNVGKTFKVDDASRMNRAKSNLNMQKEKVKRQSEKTYRRKASSRGKGK